MKQRPHCKRPVTLAVATSPPAALLHIPNLCCCVFGPPAPRHHRSSHASHAPLAPGPTHHTQDLVNKAKKKACPSCRHEFGAKFAANPRINTALTVAIRAFKAGEQRPTNKQFVR